MIDLILRGSTQAAILALLQTHGMVDADGNAASGIDYCWWAGSGKLLTAYPATYLTGQVMILRIATADDVIAEGTEQWQRSKIARYIKNNGILGSMSGIPFYELSNVRLFRFADVQTALASLGVPGHEWLGGNIG